MSKEIVGEMVIVGKIDQDQLLLNMEKLRRHMRSTQSETERFYGTLNKISSLGIVGVGLDMIGNFMKMGPQTQIAMAKLKTYKKKVGRETDKLFGEFVRDTVDAFIEHVPAETSAKGLATGVAGLGMASLFAGAAHAPLLTAMGAVAPTFAAALLVGQMFKESNAPSGGVLGNEDIQGTIDYTEPSLNNIGSTYGATSMRGFQAPQWVENLNVGNISYYQTNSAPFTPEGYS